MKQEKSHKKDPLTIQSVERALSILELLLQSGRPMSVVEICHQVQIQRTTLYALLNTLVEKGYVIKIAGEGKFVISSKMYELSIDYPARLPIVQLIRPRLVELGQRFHTAVRIAIPNSQGKFIPVISINSLQSTIAQTSSNEYPLHATSTGKLVLSYMEDAQIRAFLQVNELTRYTGLTITDPEQIWQEVYTIRQKGYSMDNREFFPDIMCISFPITDLQHHLLAVTTFSGNFTYINGISDELIPAGLQCSKLLSMDISETLPLNQLNLTGRP